LYYTSGTAYWLEHAKPFYETLDKEGYNCGKANELIQDKLCSLELFPYHSKKFGIPRKILEGVPSVQKMRAFTDELAKDPSKLLVVLRKGNVWGYKPGSRICINTPAQARSGTMKPHVRKIVKFLTG
jgi:hypothetical protein